MERLLRLLPEASKLEPFSAVGMDFWKVYDEADALIGYAFAAVVPEVVPDIPDMEEMDKYQVLGILDPKKFEIVNIAISLHPEGPEEPWTQEITEPAFERQYIGLKVDEIDLAPDGKIDAVTDATLSSTWITDAIREKVAELIKIAGGET